jgi:hypothetical protein
MEELQVALPIEDHHRDLVPVAGRTEAASKILRDDIAQQGCLSGSCLAEDDPLHDPDLVRPKPWGAYCIISKDHGIFLPGSLDVSAVACRR